ncbi:MAG: exo-alpha-sialidase [Planctomycetaceae bacterium]|nr:exo-alpha-sialidase [Planctomycetaceae bacterium]
MKFTERTIHLDRRQFLAHSTAAATILFSGQLRADSAQTSAGLIHSIEREVLFNGRTGGGRWFHPRACVVPGREGNQVLMALQSISGSDVFGPVHWTLSNDAGKTWSKPELIPGLGRTDFDADHEVGVCDVTPQYHSQTQSTIAMGHNVYYREGVLARPQLTRWPVYAIRNADGNWSEPRKLVWNDPRGAFIYTCNCGQRLVLDNGELLIAFTYGATATEPRFISTVRCTYDGSEINIVETGNALHNKVKRGLLEPSLTRYDGKYYVTIRAEDERGYVAASGDGLHWEEEQAWCWDDGEPLVMSTTQQHWLEHSDALYLVYTRKDDRNAKVIRYRAPIYMAQVDLKTLRLKRETEQVVLPLLGDPENNPRGVAMMGNFNITHLNQNESWVTVGETLPFDGYKGNTLLARIKWSHPNQLVAK